jgi:glycosyltransferase involved in cell wall biosynthesis
MQTLISGYSTVSQGRGQPPTFCVVLPVFNEEGVIEPVVRSIAAVLETVPTRTAIVAVDDGSKDSSAKILKRLQADVPLLIVASHRQNAGYGEANRTGFKAALREGFDYALVMDADGTQDPRFIFDFVTAMTKGADVIKATRYTTGSRVEGVDWRRRLVSFLGNKLAGVLVPLPITDYTNGFRALSSRVLKELDTRERGFSMLIEEVSQARHLGASFSEVPYTLTVRDKKESKSKFVYSTHVYLKYLGHLLSPPR